MARLTFHLILHTHWDREWYQSAAAFQARLVPMLDDLLAALERDPAFRSFLLDGQTVLVEDYLRVRPEAEARLQRLASAGRLQMGPWYVLADELTPSAESLIRNLLIGVADGRRLGGGLHTLYSPDAFGHPAAWPSLAREFGIGNGALWRGLAPRAGDGDLYRWRAPDGAEVLLYHLPRAGYEVGAALPADAAALAAAWAGVRDQLVGRARSSHVAVFVGADHHAAHPAPARLRELLAALEPEHEVRLSRLDEFLAAAAEHAHVPDIAGELRWSYGYAWTLQGTHGTRLPLKRRNARAELALERFAEPLAALAARAGGRDRRALLRAGWRALIRSQFHDTICGCSHDDVAAIATRRIADASATARAVTRDAVHELAGHDPDRARETDERPQPALVLWNPAARPRRSVAIADLTCFRHDILVGPPGHRVARVGKGWTPFSLADEAGHPIPVQVIERRDGIERIEAARHYPDADAVEIVRVAFETPTLPGLGSAVLHTGRPAALRQPPHPARAAGRTLGNGLIDITVRSDGTIALTDLRCGERFGALLGIESERDAGDAYTFERVERDRPRRSTVRAEFRILAGGPLVAIAESRWDALDAAFRMVLSVRAGEPFARVVLELDNRGTDRRLRLRLPLQLAGAQSVAGAPFVSERRGALEPDLPGYPVEQPVATAPAQRFAGAAIGTRGLALLAPGHFEFEWTPGGDLYFTLLRSIGELSHGDLTARPGHAGWPTSIPRAQCLGHDRIEFALAPLAEPALRGARVHEIWEDAFLPPGSRWLREAEPLRAAHAAVELAGEGLVLSAVKPAEDGDGMILRCCNVSSAAQEGTWWIEPPPALAWRVRADEGMPLPVALEAATGALRFHAAPHEIITFRVT